MSMHLLKQSKKNQSNKKQTPYSNRFFEEQDTNFVYEFKDLPIKIQQMLIPYLERI